ncbi:MAG: nitroreductase family protein, partial [Oscillospiraceae bacterium]|nr:nitroreductase family protein [Oscillospiraceae bacterium]
TNGYSPFIEINSDDRITEICDTLSIGASIENILLKSTEIGIGTLWIANTCFAYPELVDFLNTQNKLIGAIALGYANETPPPRPRKDSADVIEYRL